MWESQGTGWLHAHSTVLPQGGTRHCPPPPDSRSAGRSSFGKVVTGRPLPILPPCDTKGSPGVSAGPTRQGVLPPGPFPGAPLPSATPCLLPPPCQARSLPVTKLKEAQPWGFFVIALAPSPPGWWEMQPPAQGTPSAQRQVALLRKAHPHSLSSWAA